MGNIPASTTLKIEDFAPDEQKWIGKLLQPLNEFIANVVASVNGGLEIGVNLPCQTKVLEFTYSGEVQLPITFACTLQKTRPVEMRICQAFEENTPVVVVGPWSFGNNTVSIWSLFKVTGTGFSALTVGNKYRLVVRVQP